MRNEITGNENEFEEVISIIEQARSNALRAVNTELIKMYWEIGKYISLLCLNSDFGDKKIDFLASYIKSVSPGIKGFNRRNLYRMKQFYETYKDDEFVSPVVTQISWTNHLIILSSCKTN